MNDRQRYGLLAAGIGVAGLSLSVLGFLAVRSPAVARLTASSDGIAALVTGVAFTAVACVVVLHYGRRSAQLSGAYHELHRVTLQRERSEAALRESERFTRATLDAMDAHIAVLDADGVIMAVNRAWRASPHALVGAVGPCDVGSNYVALCTSAKGAYAVEAERVATAIREIVAGERDDCLLESHVHADGRLLVTRVTRFAGRGPLRLVVAHQDVTALARVPLELEQERDRVETLMETLPVAVFWSDALGRLTTANAHFLALGGLLDLDTARGAGWFRMLHPEDREPTTVRWQRMVAERRTDELALRLVAADGTVRACWLRTSIVPDGAGGVDGFVATVLDVTDRQRAAEASSRERAFLRRVVDLDRNLIFAKDRDGRFTFANAATAELYGTTLGEIIGCTEADFVPEAVAAELRRTDLDVMDTLVEQHGVDQALRDRAGNVRWFETAKYPIVGSDGHGEMVLGVAVDVTARRRLEGELRATAEGFRALAESMPTAIYLADAQGRWLYANPQWRALSGLDDVASSGHGWLLAFHPDDEPGLRATFREAGAQPGLLSTECRLRTAQGAERWVHVLSKALANEAGVVEGFVGSLLDVTERKQADEAARTRQAELVHGLDARTRERDRLSTITSDLLCVSTQTHFTLVNPAFTEVLGFSRDELLERPTLDFVHPDDHEVTRRALDRLRAGEPVVALVNRLRHRDGTWRWVSWTAMAESPDEIYACGRDVTASHDAEEEHRRAADELRDLYDNAPCGYHSLDPNGVILAMNQTALAWLGYAREDLIGRRRFVELLTPASAERFATSFPELERRGTVRDLECDVVRKDGTILPVSLSATAVVDADGRFVRSRSTMFDVTERRHVAARVEALHQALARRAVELEKANRELEAFSYSVSHDLRAPLRAIDGFARILEEENASQLDAGGQRHLGVIRENATRMTQVIDALLALSRLGRRPLHRASVDMMDLARTVTEDVRRGHSSREVVVAIDGLAPAVGDVTLLRQLFSNLIGNAFKYTSKVTHPCIDVGSVDADDGPVYYVRDNGAGFDMRYADKLFQVFERLHSPGDFDGAGIGLAVVQRVVERHGGRVWAEGRVGDGATFFFTLGREGEGGAAPA